MRLKTFYRTALFCLLQLALASLASAQKILPDAVTELSTQIAKHVTSAQKTRIAVIPFRELGGQPTVLGTYIAEELVTDLVNSGNLDLVERATLDKVMGELKLNESGAIDPGAAKQVGKLVGADAIVTGTIADLQSYVGVNCRLIDTQTGRIFAAAQTRIVKDDDVKKIIGMPIASSADGGAQTSPRGTTSQARSSGKPVFATESYRLVADSLRKMGNNMSLTLGLEVRAEKPGMFRIGYCYLLDENGERWKTVGVDTGRFDNLEMIPGTRVRSTFTLEGDSSGGAQFTFICTEFGPQNQRRIVIPGISPQ